MLQFISRFLAIVITAALKSAEVNAFMSSPMMMASQSVGGGGLPAGDPTTAFLTTGRDIWPNWKMAGLQSLGGIPNRTGVCNAGGLSPIGGGSDDTTNIQNAINNCSTPCTTYSSAAACVVQLNSGTFTLSASGIPTINKGVVLRGQGPGVTTISRTNGAILNNSTVQSPTFPNIVMGGNTSTGTFQSLGANAAKGDYGVTLSAAPSGISIGTLVHVDELGDGQAMSDCCVGTGGGATVQVWAASDYSLEWNAHQPVAPGGLDSACFDNSFQSNGNCTTPPGANHTDGNGYSIRPGGVHEEEHLVTGIGVAACSAVFPAATANSICFDSPLTIPLRTANSAGVMPWTGIVQFAGLENMTIQLGGDGNIQWKGCVYCWANKIESYHYFNPGIDFKQGNFRDHLENYWAHNATWPINGGGGYSLAIDFGSSEIYIVNGISMLANKVIVVRASGAGSVVAYNYMDDGYIGTSNNSNGWVETGANCSHMAGGGRTLFEGNRTFNVDSDFTHGASTYCAYFRNHITGIRAPFTGEFTGVFNDDSTGCCGPMRAAASHPYTYWTSFIGNILGLSGVTTGANGWVYSTNGSVGGNAGSPSMLKLGWDDFNTSPQSTKDDVAATIWPAAASGTGPTYNTASVCNALTDPCQTIVTGNWDYVQGQTTWDSRGAKIIPPSFYLPSAPPFFSGFTWPPYDPIAPTVAGVPAYIRWSACQPAPTAACLFSANPQVSLTAKPSTISAGQSSTLTWAAFNAPSCAGTGFSTGGVLAGSASTGALSTTTSYSVTCGGTTQNVTVTVNPLVASTWDPAHKGAGVTLSGTPANTIATNTTTGTTMTFATQQDNGTTAKNYFELKCITTGTNNGLGVKLSNSGISYIGFDNTSIGFYRTNILQNNVTVGSWAGCANGDTVGFLADETVSPPTIAAAVLHAGAWGAFSSAISMGSGMPQGTLFYVAGDPEDSGDSDGICTHSSCAATPSGIPGGAQWYDGI